jgi:hypothetical protein
MALGCKGDCVSRRVFRTTVILAVIEGQRLLTQFLGHPEFLSSALIALSAYALRSSSANIDD